MLVGAQVKKISNSLSITQSIHAVFLLFFFMRLAITQNLSSQVNAYAYVRMRNTCVVFPSRRNICHSQAVNEKKRPKRLKWNDYLTDDSKKQTCPNSIWNPKDETINRKKMWIHRNHTFIAYQQEKDTHADILSIDFNEKKILELHTQIEILRQNAFAGIWDIW